MGPRLLPAAPVNDRTLCMSTFHYTFWFENLRDRALTSALYASEMSGKTNDITTPPTTPNGSKEPVDLELLKDILVQVLSNALEQLPLPVHTELIRLLYASALLQH